MSKNTGKPEAYIRKRGGSQMGLVNSLWERTREGSLEMLPELDFER